MDAEAVAKRVVRREAEKGIKDCYKIRGAAGGKYFLVETENKFFLVFVWNSLRGGCILEIDPSDMLDFQI